MYLDDMSKPGAYTYQCVIRRDGLEGRALVRQQMLAPFKGAYEMDAYGAKQRGGRMGTQQQQRADDLALEAKGNLTRALYAAGWSSEQRAYAGRTCILWIAPHSSTI